MRLLAEVHGFAALITPVRPSQKSRDPLTPIEQYVSWQHSDGAPFDPWLRTHLRLGGKQLRIAPQSMTITGTVAEWEDWTNMRFPQTGRYVVPAALEPIVIDREANCGRYIEPNVWVLHEINAHNRPVRHA